MSPPLDATQILNAISTGDTTAAERLLPLVYEELRALAGSRFRGQPSDHTLQPTALVHEAFLRLIDQNSVQWQSRAHFVAVAATAMRQILADHARRKRTDKRGGGMARVGLDGVGDGAGGELDILALDDALTRLAALDPRRHRVVELRYFGGLSVEEVAALLSVSVSTVESDWRSARAWLSVQLGE